MMLRACLLATVLADPRAAVEGQTILPPKFAALLARAEADPASVARDLVASPLAQLATPLQPSPQRGALNGTLPLVVAHGMGDSCFNPGMMSLASVAGEHLGVYSRCVATGNNVITDTLNSFLMTMDGNVDEFATRVRADENLRAGFYAFGVSQGSNVIRGYIQRYNDPP